MSAAVTDRPPETMTQPDDLARIVAFVLDLPNTASIAALPDQFHPGGKLVIVLAGPDR